MDALEAVYTFIAKGGWLAVLILLLWTGARGSWYFAYTVADLRGQLDAARKDGDQWKALYLDLVTQQRQLVEVVETASKRGR